MTSKRGCTVYWCDAPDCAELIVNRQPGWWLGHTGHYCPAHLPTCIRCGVRLRPDKANLADYPGTARANGKGRCMTCANEVRQAARVDAKPALGDTEARQLRRLLYDHLDDPDDRALVLNQLGLIGDDV